MAQTPEGANKVAAQRCGISVAEYEARVALGQKRCTKCKSWKPVNYFGVDASRYDGLAAKCRSCGRRSNGPSDTERAGMRQVGFEWCSGCLEWRTREFIRRTGSRCTDCINRKRRERYANDAEFRHAMRQSAYRRKRLVDDVPPDGAEFLLSIFDGLCAYCGDVADTWDHVVPVSRGGRTTPGNILPACRSCNGSKNDSDVQEFIERQGIIPTDLLWDRLAFMDASLYG